MTTTCPARLMLPMLALAMLGGCQKESAPTRTTSLNVTEEAESGANTQASASEAPGGRLVLPVIAGRPAAAYIAWRNRGTAPVTITGIAIDGAKSADMHETKGGAMLPLPKLTLAPGEEANFVPGGRHAMVYGLPADAKAGGSLTYKLLLSDGKTLPGTLTVEAAGATHGMDHDMGHDMGGMKM